MTGSLLPYSPLCIMKPRLAAGSGDICAQWRGTCAAARGALAVIVDERLSMTAERGKRASMRLSKPGACACEL